MAAKDPDKGVFDFTDGGRYIGAWNGDGANGHGVCVGPSDSGVFEGRWENGIQSSGVFTWSNGQQYKGTWRDGMRHGVGKEVCFDVNLDIQCIGCNSASAQFWNRKVMLYLQYRMV